MQELRLVEWFPDRRISNPIRQHDARDVTSGHPVEMWLPSRDCLVRVPIADIVRIVAERDYVRISTLTTSFLIRMPLSKLDAILDGGPLVRIHRSMMVAKNDIAALRHIAHGAWCVMHRNGSESKIGRKFYARLRLALGIDFAPNCPDDRSSPG